MVAEHPVDLDDFDVANLRGGEHFARGVRAGHVRGGADLGVLSKRGFHAPLRPKAKKHRHDEEEEVVSECHCWSAKSDTQ